jgi:hypothetical protein
MKKTKPPVPFMVRLYKKQSDFIKQQARKHNISQAEVVRRHIEANMIV